MFEGMKARKARRRYLAQVRLMELERLMADNSRRLQELRAADAECPWCVGRGGFHTDCQEQLDALNGA